MEGEVRELQIIKNILVVHQNEYTSDYYQLVYEEQKDRNHTHTCGTENEKTRQDFKTTDLKLPVRTKKK
jgi:hypothetical protein